MKSETRHALFPRPWVIGHLGAGTPELDTRTIHVEAFFDLPGCSELAAARLVAHLQQCAVGFVADGRLVGGAQ